MTNLTFNQNYNHSYLCAIENEIDKNHYYIQNSAIQKWYSK
jgi:hypothetical protein